MPIKKKDNLYNLVKNLGKNEKKFLREFLKKTPGEKLYLMLFNKIDQQSKHLPQDVKKSFDEKANQLPVIKSYLQELIQKVLNFYHYDSSLFDKTHHGFLKINRLLERELFDLAENEIEKCVKRLRPAEMPFELLRALEFRKELLLKKHGPTSTECQKELNALLVEQNSVLESIFNLQQLEDLRCNFFDHFQRGSGLNPVIYTDLNKNPLVTDENKALSLRAKLLQADLLCRTHLFRNQDFAAAEEALQKAIRQLEIRPDQIRQSPWEYLSLLNQKLQLQIHQRHLPEIYDTLLTIQRAPADFGFDLNTPRLRRSQLETLALELEIHVQSGDRAKGRSVIELIDRQFTELNSPALRQWRTVMNYEIGKYYFRTGDDRAARQRLLEIRKAEHSRRESETLLASIFLRALIALKAKKNLELKKVAAELENYFKNERKAKRLEKHLFNLLQSWPELAVSTRRRRKLTALLDKVRRAAEANPSPALEDLVEWLLASN